MIHISLRIRFQSRVQRCIHGEDCPYCCWPWQAGRRGHYGGFWAYGKNHGSHRIAWELGNNQILPEGRAHFVCHYCDYKLCCNPQHLYLGDAYSNTSDALARGQMAVGEQVWHLVKMTEENVHEAIQLRQEGWLLEDIAARYGVTNGAISCIMRGTSWRHLRIEGAIAYHTKMTEQQVREAVRLRVDGWTLQAIGERYGVTQHAIYRIVHGDNWKHIQIEGRDY